MHVLLFGATGMIGHGAPDVCLHDEAVEHVTVVGRRATGRGHPKLTERVSSAIPEERLLTEDLPGSLFYSVGSATSVAMCGRIAGTSTVAVCHTMSKSTTK